MKRRIILSIALILSIISVLLMSSDSSVNAQQGQTMKGTYTFGTGVIALPTSQNLSVAVAALGDANGDGRIDGNDTIIVRYRQTRYAKTGCESGVCRYAVESQTTSPPMISAPNQSSKLDVMGNQIGTDAAVSIEVLSSSKNARVTVQLTDALTGRTESVLVALMLP
jgi:hypothetical protein